MSSITSSTIMNTDNTNTNTNTNAATNQEMTGELSMPMFSSVNPEQFFFKKPVAKKQGSGKNWYVDSKEGSNTAPFFQMKPARAPFGINKKDGLSVEQTIESEFKIKIPCEIDGEDLAAFLHKLDYITLDQAKQQRADLWDKNPKIDDNKINSSYFPLVKHDNEGKWPSLYTLKAVTKGDKATRVFIMYPPDKPGEQPKYCDASLKDIVSGVRILPIVQVGGCWISQVGFGMELIATDILIYPKVKQPEFRFNLQEKPVKMSDAESLKRSHDDIEEDGDEDDTKNSKISRQD